VAQRAFSPKQLSDIVHVLREAGVVYALVFGSGARESLRFDSDLDLAVAGENRLSGTERFELVRKLAAVTGRPVDLVDLKTARGVVFARALQGKELFCDSVKAKGEALARRVGLVEEDLALAKRTFAIAQRRMFR
jgi:predicted nucleotidyltransferase